MEVLASEAEVVKWLGGAVGLGEALHEGPMVVGWWGGNGSEIVEQKTKVVIEYRVLCGFNSLSRIGPPRRSNTLHRSICTD